MALVLILHYKLPQVREHERNNLNKNGSIRRPGKKRIHKVAVQGERATKFLSGPTDGPEGRSAAGCGERRMKGATRERRINREVPCTRFSGAADGGAGPAAAQPLSRCRRRRCLLLSERARVPVHRCPFSDDFSRARYRVRPRHRARRSPLTQPDPNST